MTACIGPNRTPGLPFACMCAEPNPFEGLMRLVDSSGSTGEAVNSGRLQVLFQGSWFQVGGQA